jgi:hypothetical protein
MSEARIIKQITDYLDSLNEPVWWFKVHGSRWQKAGVPDLCIVYRGWAVYLEVKQEGKEPTSLQRHTMKQIKAAGGTAEVVRSVEDTQEILERVSR